MNKKELEAFAKQTAKSIKTEADLTDFRKMLTKVMSRSYRSDQNVVTSRLKINRFQPVLAKLYRFQRRFRFFWTKMLEKLPVF